MFKKDFEIQRDSLVQLWMAQGLLHPSPGESKDMEDIGNEYFDILLQSSLFQDATMNYDGIVRECKMHDLVHDLAEFVSKSEILTSDLSGIDNTLEIRHVAWVSTSELEKIPKKSARKLQSLFLDDGEVPNNIHPWFKTLRVLKYGNPNIEEFPDSIGRLKHLRYLDISKTRFKALPKSIGKLYNLQTLRATKCALEEFLKELLNLINLRHIHFDESTKFPQGIRQLTCLQTLPYFSVGNEIGHRIEELASLNQLKGELIICGLEHVKNGQEAKKAKLEEKTKACHLTFRWTGYRSTTDNNKEDDVLEGLRPHPELESLRIENFMGDKFPLWMMNGSLLFENLKRIQLLGWDKCDGVLLLGHLPNLTELEIIEMANLKCVDGEFYSSLERLVVRNCGKLRHLPGGIHTFHLLKHMYISECPSLKLIPITQGLKYMYISKCPSVESIPITQGMASLRKLEIGDCGRLSRLPSGLENCTVLQNLIIRNCDELSGTLSLWASLLEVSLWSCNGLSGPLSVWSPLVELDIHYCSNPTSIEMKGSLSLTASLEKLTIWNCHELTSLPALPQQCPSLQKLWISGCPKVSSFGVKSSRLEEECISLQSTSDLRTMTSLRHLSIERCERLGSWVCET
ncbi:putative disease resistance protein RGA3 isoform X2 [Malus domestica]|uniref:putative disease resistance protein RGA3 isoform X2 n=1 Tax=Malus domestica TaxID=3750 RepID=UPI0039760232